MNDSRPAFGHRPAARANRARGTACAVACAIAIAESAWAQTASSLETLLAGEMTPGTVAQLVEHVNRPEVIHRLAAALAHARPDVRAAAARVAFVVGARGLLPTMRTALAAEASADPAVEMTRALATFGDPSHDGALIEAWARLGRSNVARAAVAYATARGPAALDALAVLRAHEEAEPALTAFIRAARPDVPALIALVERALDTGDVLTFHAALGVSEDRRAEIPDALLIRALDVDRPPRMRRGAARHVFSRWNDRSRPAPLLIAALAADAPYASDANDPEALALKEFAGRAAGRPPTTTREWLARFDDPDLAIAGLAMMPGVARALTDRERRKLRDAIPGFGRRPARLSAPKRPSDATVHLLDPYPLGFMPDLLARTGCDTAKARREGLGAGGAQLTLHPDGRVARVSLINTGVSQASCADAVRVLFMTHVARNRPTGGEQWIAVAPLDDEYIACRESQAHDSFGVTPGGSARIEPPTKTRHVNPVYPETAQAARVEGTVVLDATIGTNGCVGDLHVTSSVDPRLDLSALLSVLGWRFTPTMIAGVPVPVIMTVTVRYSLR